MRIAVIGVGYVGNAIVRMLCSHYDVLAKDVRTEQNYSPIGGQGYGAYISEDDYKNVNVCDAAVVCAPTEMDDEGTCDISVVESVVKLCECRYILLKSTVPPGTTRALAEKYDKLIAFSPEYLGESKYFTPFWKYPHPRNLKYHNFQIFGGEKEVTNFFVELFQRVMGPDCKYLQTDSTTAELTKYMENAWAATKVTFVNEFYRIATAFNVDYRELRELWLLDPRINRMHTSVFEGKFGYDGKCLPKDISAIVEASVDAGYCPDLLIQVIKSNEEFCSDNIKEE